jgi:hypothetical protein
MKTTKERVWACECGEVLDSRVVLMFHMDYEDHFQGKRVDMPIVYDAKQETKK